MGQNCSSSTRSEWTDDHVLADIQILPKALCTAKDLAACGKIFVKYKLDAQLQGLSTSVQGRWDILTEALKTCHTEVHEGGSARIDSNMRFSTRTDRAQTISDQIRRVQPPSMTGTSA